MSIDTMTSRRITQTLVAAAFLISGCTEPNPFGTFTGDMSGSSGATSTTGAPDTGAAESSGQATTLGNTASVTDASTSTTGTSASGLDTNSEDPTTPIDSSSSTGDTIVCEPNGFLDGNEECDDDNPFDGDGCTACQVDDGWVCTSEPSMCYAACDPLLQDCGIAGYGCYPVDDEVWGCAPDASGEMGGLGDACEYLNVCDPGFACVDPEHFEACASASGCCAALCDLDDPSCPIRWTCTPYYDGAVPAGLEQLGICSWQ